jgi:hypothetical protein
MVSYSDLISHDLAASVAASVDEIRGFPGVSDAVREDRELIVVWGTSVNLDTMQTHLERWWRQRLLGK